MGNMLRLVCLTTISASSVSSLLCLLREHQRRGDSSSSNVKNIRSIILSVCQMFPSMLIPSSNVLISLLKGNINKGDSGGGAGSSSESNTAERLLSSRLISLVAWTGRGIPKSAAVHLRPVLVDLCVEGTVTQVYHIYIF